MAAAKLQADICEVLHWYRLPVGFFKVLPWSKLSVGFLKVLPWSKLSAELQFRGSSLPESSEKAQSGHGCCVSGSGTRAY